MKEQLFEELLESVRQGGAILRGRKRPSRVFRFEEPDVRALREAYGLSQAKFAALMGISAATLRNWEQGRRQPEGSARVLLRVVARHPGAVLDVARSAPSNQRLQRTGRRTSRHGRTVRAAGR
jgi:putative transcriptional regulator